MNAYNKIRSAFVLGDGISQKLKLFCITFWFPLRRRLGVVGMVAPRLRLHALGKSFYFYPTDGSDLGVLLSVFIEKEYSLKGLAPKIILDIGSNVGASVIYFKLVYPEARIYAYEPDPVTFEKLKRNTAQFENIHLRNCAVSGADGKVVFYIYPGSSMSSSLYRRVEGQKAISIPSKTLSTILIEEKLSAADLIKFDIEGAEFSVFEKCSEIARIKHLIGEIHEDIAGKTAEDFIALFPGFLVIRKDNTLPRRYIIELRSNSSSA